MNHYRRQVDALVRGIEVTSPTTFSWFGQPSPRLSSRVRRAVSAETARRFLLFNLELQLYNGFYRTGSATSRQPNGAGPPTRAAVPLVEDLSAANCGIGYWEDGWEAYRIEEGKAGLRKDGLEVWTLMKDCLTPDGVAVVPGTQVSLRLPKELLSMSPGYYMALGNNELAQDDESVLLRLYWHLTPEGAVRLMRDATSSLNRAGLPFKLKVVNDPAGFVRCDAGVLYLRRQDYDAVAEMLGKLLPRLQPFLKPGTPTFTKRLAIGIGLAEDPGGGESFGQHRCRLLAEALVGAHEQGRRSAAERLRVVEGRFAEAGITLDRPFLNPGSSDRYALRAIVNRRPHPMVVASTQHDGETTQAGFLQVAGDIGLRLCRQALWHRDRCTWLGAERVARSFAGEADLLTYRTLGPELYSGTGGVALFLAFLHSVTGDALTQRTALGALRQAASRIRALPRDAHLGLYSGWTGIAFAAASVGTLLGEERWLKWSRQLLNDCRQQTEADHGFDMISGAAGAITALLRLQEVLGDDSLLEFATRLGDRLLETAEESEAGYSWRSATYAHRRNLTGLSHGTAGVGLALLELFRVSGEPRYWRAANLAFEYERHWFDPTVGNWPDFREVPSEYSLAGGSQAFAAAWCHGAPGIALSRLRSYEVFDDQVCKVEAQTALRTTRRMVRTALASSGENFCLCHGLAGNAEVLLEGSRILGNGCTDGASIAHEVARVGMESYGSAGSPWPCGNGGGETPSLMLGLAGIGHFYLRLSHPPIPSVLMICAPSNRLRPIGRSIGARCAPGLGRSAQSKSL